MSMYQLDILVEEIILRWFSQGATSEQSRQLRKNQGVGGGPGMQDQRQVTCSPPACVRACACIRLGYTSPSFLELKRNE